MPPIPETLDLGRWLALWSRLAGTGPGTSVFYDLAQAYAEPARVYHTAAHINDCLTLFDWSHHLASRPDEMEAALWFHDAVYLPGASDNEERSAQLAEMVLGSGAVPSAAVQHVAEMILSTKHLSIPPEPDTQLLCDIDLSILGRADSKFDDFERRIRQEYAWVPEQAYRTARSSILKTFLQRPAIYQTQPFAERYEAQARRNLERLLADFSH